MTAPVARSRLRGWFNAPASQAAAAGAVHLQGPTALERTQQNPLGAAGGWCLQELLWVPVSLVALWVPSAWWLSGSRQPGGSLGPVSLVALWVPSAWWLSGSPSVRSLVALWVPLSMEPGGSLGPVSLVALWVPSAWWLSGSRQPGGSLGPVSLVALWVPLSKEPGGSLGPVSLVALWVPNSLEPGGSLGPLQAALLSGSSSRLLSMRGRSLLLDLCGGRSEFKEITKVIFKGLRQGDIVLAQEKTFEREEAPRERRSPESRYIHALIPPCFTNGDEDSVRSGSQDGVRSGSQDGVRSGSQDSVRSGSQDGVRSGSQDG
ncbi:unnamed protein product [Gadus morhua 'NCC']